MRCVALSVVCMIAVLPQVGCRSVYRLQCKSYPSRAGVLVGEQMMGETPCTIAIPRKSEFIEDGKVELTFCLPDGREKVEVVDLHGLKPSSPLAEVVSAPFMFVGAGLLVLSGAGRDSDEEEDSFFAADEEEEDNSVLCTGLLGAGVGAAGVGLYYLFGGDEDSLTGPKVLVYFDKPTRATENEGTDGRRSP